jgi:sugar phosphate isomerase/epimerase
MSFVILGTVSNGWTDLLRESTLADQCRRAVELGFGYVELRQRGLGDCEHRVDGDDRPWPIPERLSQLALEFPRLGFNLAVEAPFLTTLVDSREPYMERCVAAAVALNQDDPVLRLVDLSPATSPLEHEEAIDELGHSVAELARHLARQGVRLALENSRQPLISLRAVIRRAAFALPEDAPIPQICWDPHNQIAQRFLEEDPVETARLVAVEEWFEFHFKQSKDRALLPDVGNGEIDWRLILAALHAKGYRGPALFELPAGPDIWERLERSTAYIRGLLGEVEAS